MKEGRKRAVSLRISVADIRKIKLLAQRLDARDSDVIRFAVKSMLTRFASLCDHEVHGRALLPALIDAGGEFFHHFDLDESRLTEIVNAGVSKAQEVESDDLKLIAMAAMQQGLVKVRLHKTAKLGSGGRTPDLDETLAGNLRGYLYSKYVDREVNSEAAND
jgi:hypothetical protein